MACVLVMTTGDILMYFTIVQITKYRTLLSKYKINWEMQQCSSKTFDSTKADSNPYQVLRALKVGFAKKQKRSYDKQSATAFEAFELEITLPSYRKHPGSYIYEKPERRSTTIVMSHDYMMKLHHVTSIYTLIEPVTTGDFFKLLAPKPCSRPENRPD